MEKSSEQFSPRYDAAARGRSQCHSLVLVAVATERKLTAFSRTKDWGRKKKKKKKQLRDEAGMNWFGREGEREGGIYHGEPGDSSGPGPDDSAFSSCSARAPCCCCCCYRGGGGWRGETEDGDDNEEVEEGA